MTRMDNMIIMIITKDPCCVVRMIAQCEDDGDAEDDDL